MNYATRLEKLRLLLKTTPCDAFLIENPVDLYYLTGMNVSTGKIIITSSAAIFIVDGRYIEKCKNQTLYSVQLANENLLKNILTDLQIHQLGFDQTHTTYEAFLHLSNILQVLKSQSYLIELIPSPSIVQKLRLIKDNDEIDCLRKAAILGYKGYELVSSLLREGITESELAFALEFFWKKQGASKLAFEPIIAFGPNSSMPHYRASDTPLKKNSHVLIDIGCVLSNYHSDMTRVVFFDQPSPVIQEIYQIVQEAKDRAIDLCRPGILIGELDSTARDWITKKGYGDQFTHSLGHGIGLEIHEKPIIRKAGIDAMTPLVAGMVITIEPGIYLPNIGGVRLEDTILITEKGHENLTIAFG